MISSVHPRLTNRDRLRHGAEDWPTAIKHYLASERRVVSLIEATATLKDAPDAIEATTERLCEAKRKAEEVTAASTGWKLRSRRRGCYPTPTDGGWVGHYVDVAEFALTAWGFEGFVGPERRSRGQAAERAFRCGSALHRASAAIRPAHDGCLSRHDCTSDHRAAAQGAHVAGKRRLVGERADLR